MKFLSENEETSEPERESQHDVESFEAGLEQRVHGDIGEVPCSRVLGRGFVEAKPDPPYDHVIPTNWDHEALPNGYGHTGIYGQTEETERINPYQKVPCCRMRHARKRTVTPLS